MSTTISRHPNVEQFGVDLASREFWARSFEEREQSFARLRAEAPVVYSRPYLDRALTAAPRAGRGAGTSA